MERNLSMSRITILLFVFVTLVGNIYAQKKNTELSGFARYLIHELNETDRKYYLGRYFENVGSISVYDVEKITKNKSKSDTLKLSGIMKIKNLRPSFLKEELIKIMPESYTRVSSYGFVSSILIENGDTILCDFELDKYEVKPHSLESPTNDTTSIDVMGHGVWYLLSWDWSTELIPSNIKKLKVKYANSKQSEKDLAFSIVYDRMLRITAEHSEGDPMDNSYRNQLKKLTKYGFKLGGNGSFYFLLIDYKFLSAQFKGFISTGAQTLLDVYLTEQVTPSEEEEPYRRLLTADKALGYLVKFESIFSSVQDNFLLMQAEELFLGYLHYVFKPVSEYSIPFPGMGIFLDNTPMLDTPNSKLDKSFKAAYIKASKKYPDSFVGAFATEYLQMLEKNDFSLKEDVKKFLTGKGLITPITN
ncbi:MAG: hypothetical protein J0L60_13970 [Ignavibacteria bacterium]|nr:hypothetical protein [Ignavibacteria bacterium]